MGSEIHEMNQSPEKEVFLKLSPNSKNYRKKKKNSKASIAETLPVLIIIKINKTDSNSKKYFWWLNSS